MLDDIKANVGDINDLSKLEDYLKKMLDKKAFDNKGLIYGLGHAVYTLSDPRALLLKEQAKKLAKEKGMQEEYEFIENVEKIGARLVQEKNKAKYASCANIDMYSGFVYQMLGIPEELYTPLFAVSRMSGWAAHRLEQILDEKIIRPAYKSISNLREYEPFSERREDD